MADEHNYTGTSTQGALAKHIFPGLPADKPFVADLPQPAVKVGGVKALPTFNNVTPIIAAPR